MKFKEAMEAMQAGSKVTRRPWFKSAYFLLDGTDVKSYQPELKVFQYTEDIMISDGWQVIGEEGEFKFYDIIPYLQKGLMAKLKDWKEAYIKYDPANKYLVLFNMAVFPYVPDFEAFTSEDWMVVE